MSSQENNEEEMNYQKTYECFVKDFVICIFFSGFLLNFILLTVYLEISWIFFFIILIIFSIANLVQTVFFAIRKKVMGFQGSQSRILTCSCQSWKAINDLNESLCFFLATVIMTLDFKMNLGLSYLAGLPLIETIGVNAYASLKMVKVPKLKRKAITIQVFFRFVWV